MEICIAKLAVIGGVFIHLSGSDVHVAMPNNGGLNDLSSLAHVPVCFAYQVFKILTAMLFAWFGLASTLA